MCLSYIGGKSRIGIWIRDFIPNDIETYVEPFSGAFWVFFKMNISNYPNLKKVIYNDINPLNTNLFKCLKDYKKLWEISKDIPIEDVELFNKFKLEVFDEKLKLNIPNFEIAYKYAYILSQVWSGREPKGAVLIKNGGYVGKDGIYKSKFEIFRSKLVDIKWQKYFDMISIIENSDFEDIFKKYDSSKTFFYCDPPYYNTEHYYANHDFESVTHERLANNLNSISGKFALSYYYFDLLDKWYPKDKYHWIDKNFSKSAMAVSGKLQSKGTELLIMNYEIGNK